MNDILCRQLALDYCCTPEDVRDGKNHFTEHRFLEGRRRFREGKDCFLKVAMVGGKLLFTGRPEIVARCRETYAGEDAAWFLEAGSLRRLDALLRDFGCRVGTAHPFFLPGRAPRLPAPDCGLRWFRGAEIERFRGDRRFDEAFCFCEDAPDVLGLAALRDGEIVGMAGASADSPTMWQIGINVEPEARGLASGLAAHGARRRLSAGLGRAGRRGGRGLKEGRRKHGGMGSLAAGGPGGSGPHGHEHRARQPRRARAGEEPERYDRNGGVPPRLPALRRRPRFLYAERFRAAAAEAERAELKRERTRLFGACVFFVLRRSGEEYGCREEARERAAEARIGGRGGAEAPPEARAADRGCQIPAKSLAFRVSPQKN